MATRNWEKVTTVMMWCAQSEGVVRILRLLVGPLVMVTLTGGGWVWLVVVCIGKEIDGDVQKTEKKK